jgi:hypothetical protein
MIVKYSKNSIMSYIPTLPTFLKISFFCDSVLLNCLGWPQTLNASASASKTARIADMYTTPARILVNATDFLLLSLLFCFALFIN